MTIHRIERVSYIQITPFKSKTKFRIHLRESPGTALSDAIEFDLSSGGMEKLIQLLQSHQPERNTQTPATPEKAPKGRPVLRVVTEHDGDGGS